MPTIFTWNTQGDFTHPAKENVIARLFGRWRCGVGLIQEGGGARAAGWAARLGVRSIAVGAVPGNANNRCTIWAMGRAAHGDEWYSNTLGGGVAARQASGLIYRGTLYVSWHSMAVGGLDADTAQLVAECRNEMRVGNVTRVIIGGDFNTSAANLTRVVNGQFGRRAARGMGHAVVTQPLRTHISGRTLDHFVLMWNGGGFGANVRARRAPAQSSDHWPVVLNYT